MRHGVKKARLGRDTAHRKAMLNNLATSVILKGLSEEQMDRSVTTTVQKAKAVRGLVDRLITFGKKGDLHSRRQVARFLKDKEAVKGLFETLAPRYTERPGGYTRVLKIENNRHGDNAEMAIITLVEDEVQKEKQKPAKKGTAKKKTSTTGASEEAKKEEPKAEGS